MTTPSASSFVQRTLIVLLLAALFVSVGLVSWLAAQVLLVVFAGVLVGVLLRGLAQWATTWTRLPIGGALALVCVALVLVGSGLATFLAASVSQQFAELFDQLPQAIESVRSRVAANPLGQRLLDAVPEPGTGGNTASQLVNAATATVGVLGNGVLILFLGLFFAANPGVYRRGLIRLVPPSHRDRANDVADDVGEVLLRWLAGRVVLMTVVGVLTWVGLMLMGVPLALALGVLAGALSFIPNIGPVISAIPAMLLASVEAPIMAVYVGAFYLTLQTVESYLLEPYVVKKTADLPAALVIAFQVLMGTLLGVMGLTLATPFLAMMTVLVERLYIEDILGDVESQGAA